LHWFSERDIGPLIGQMKEAFDQIRAHEMDKFFIAERQDANCKDVMNNTVNRVVNKLLHCVIQNIDQVAHQHNPHEAAKLAKGMLAHAESIIDEDVRKGKCEPSEK
jgi:glutamyl-tRNA reductase